MQLTRTNRTTINFFLTRLKFQGLPPLWEIFPYFEHQFSALIVTCGLTKITFGVFKKSIIYYPWPALIFKILLDGQIVKSVLEACYSQGVLYRYISKSRHQVPTACTCQYHRMQNSSCKQNHFWRHVKSWQIIHDIF